MGKGSLKIPNDYFGWMETAFVGEFFRRKKWGDLKGSDHSGRQKWWMMAFSLCLIDTVKELKWYYTSENSHGTPN